MFHGERTAVGNRRTRTIFILFDHPLFARGLENLLQQKGGVEVLGVAAKGEAPLTRITALKPDVVLVEAGVKRDEPATLLCRLLREQSRAQVVRLSLDDCTATLYSGRRWAAEEVEDLIEGMLAPMADSLKRSP